MAVVAPYDKTTVPTARQLHMLDRFGCGWSRPAFTQLTNAGGELAWFEQQLAPASITESATAEAVVSWFPGLRQAPEVIWSSDRSGVKRHWEYAIDLAN